MVLAGFDLKPRVGDVAKARARGPASFKRCSASGPIACPIAVRRDGRQHSGRICVSTTTGVHI